MQPCGTASVGAKRDGPEAAFLADWDRMRGKHRPPIFGADEIQHGKGQQFWTVLSDLVRGEIIGLAKDRTEDSLRTLLTTRLDARQRAAVEAVCTDMHRPYLNAVGDTIGPHFQKTLPHAR